MRLCLRLEGESTVHVGRGGLEAVTNERIPYCALNNGGMSMSPLQMESTTFIVDCWDINDM
jgi:hypothetical protein